MHRAFALAFGILVVANLSAEGKPFVYVTNIGLNSNNVSVIDASTNTVVANVPVGFSPAAIAVTPDATRAYVTNLASNNVSVIDTTANSVVATIPVGIRPVAVSIAPDGKRVYVANGAATGITTNISVIDTIVYRPR